VTDTPWTLRPWEVEQDSSEQQGYVLYVVGASARARYTARRITS
jgi:hypothetical protein